MIQSVKKLDKFKSALITTVNDVIFSYDLFTLDVYNKFRHKFNDEIKDIIKGCFKKEQSPLFDIIEVNGELVLWNVIENREASNEDKGLFIRSKSSSKITKEFYDKMEEMNMTYLFAMTVPTFRNINVDFNIFLDGVANFIFVDNPIEYGMLCQYMNKPDKIILDFRKWVEDNIDEKNNYGIILSIVSSELNIQYKLARMLDGFMNEQRAHLVQLESRIILDSGRNRELFKEFRDRLDTGSSLLLTDLFALGGYRMK